ncbi:TerB family tellurite resistance protein [Azovibrio restrictus]|uniref:tellurite resistance TerB family protein n=1 Tax=Azovibrio restrictus TaxID=146938 RepID=UPI0004145173|nr:TerB family tellurite resistance protein [Azovibrio restrictus]
MITVEDCNAFCDAPLGQVEDLARREGLPPVLAFARAHTEGGCTGKNHPMLQDEREEMTMMTMQARAMFPQLSEPRHPLRAYPINSASAKARLVVLALLADGRLDECELEVLNRRGSFAALGISREGFVQVLHEFCADVSRLAGGAADWRVSPDLLAGLFAEVTEVEARYAVLRLIISVISSDGHLARGEERLFLGALDAWGNGLAGNAALPRSASTNAIHIS